jgi:hypothetical protein
MPTTGSTPEREVGPVEQAIETDLAGLKLGTGKVFLAASARKLARAIDARGDDEAPSSLAKAVDSLFKVMAALMAKESSDPDDLRQLAAIFGSPDAGSPAVSPALRYPASPGQADRRPRNRKGGAGTRPE